MSKPIKMYVIAGEASGDLHASNLMHALIEEHDAIEFKFWGGDKMQEIAKNGLVKHIRELAFMGFIEVVMNLKTILKNISYCKKSISEFEPDVLVLVDYPGFNLRIAEWAKERGIKVYYYISPQVWAWKQSRVHKIKKVVDKMAVILPFEKDFYKKFDYNVEYVGHPLLDEIEKFKFDSIEVFRKEQNLDERPILVVLPGSRKQEVSKKLPIMLEAAKRIKTHQMVIAGAPSLDKEFYQSLCSNSIVFGKTYELLSYADVAIVTSGTATLETALFKVPQVVCYKSSKISYSIAKRLVKVKFISLVNLIMDREVVKELIQGECTSDNIYKETLRLIEDEEYRSELDNNYKLLQEKLGGGGASQKVARSLLKTIQ